MRGGCIKKEMFHSVIILRYNSTQIFCKHSHILFIMLTRSILDNCYWPSNLTDHLYLFKTCPRHSDRICHQHLLLLRDSADHWTDSMILINWTYIFFKCTGHQQVWLLLTDPGRFLSQDKEQDVTNTTLQNKYSLSCIIVWCNNSSETKN